MKRRIISTMLAFAMLITMFPTISLAYIFDDGVLVSGTTEDTMPTLSLLAFEVDNDNKAIDEDEGTAAVPLKTDNGSYVPITDFDTLAEGDSFMVALVATNFTKFTVNTDKLYQWSAGIAYDPNYIEYEPSYTIAMGSDADAQNTDFLKRLTTDNDYISSTAKTRGYTINTVVNKNTETGEGTEADVESNCTKTAYMQVSAKVDSNGDATNAVELDDSVYLSFIEFKIKANAPAGTKVFDISKSPTDLTFNFGSKGDTGYTYGSELQNYLKIDTTTLSVFPAIYNVDFYNDPTLSSAATAESLSIKEGTAIAEEDIPDSSAFTGETGKYFGVLKYTTSETADPDNDPEFKAGVKLTSDVKVYAKWDDGYTVTLHSNYDSNDPNGTAEITVAPTDEVTISQDDINSALGKDGVTWDEREGYSITGWAKAAGATTADFTLGTDKITGDTDLYAVWAEIIKITFNANGGTGAEKTVEINPGSGVESSDIPTYTKDKYRLKGWNTKANLGGTRYDSDLSGVTFSEATTLYAEWTPADGQESVTLTFVTDHGTAAPPTVTVVKGDDVTADMMPDDPTAEDYNFKGWFKSASISDTTKIEAPITMEEDLTLYAHWDYTGTDKITVSFYQNDGASTAAIASVDVAPNSTLGDMMPENPERDNFGFDGWNTATDGNGSEFTKDTAVTTNNNNLYAQWTKNITVKYNVNGGTGTIEDAVGAPTESYSDPTDAPTKANYEFLGWNTKQNGAGAYIAAAEYSTYQDVADAAESTDSTVTLYAQWGDVKDPTDFTPDGPVDPSATGVIVTFDENVGADDVNKVTSAVNPKYKYPNLGDSIGADNMPDSPERNNYTFAGWYTKPGGQGTMVDGATAITEALGAVKISDTEGYKLTLYAKWTLNDDVADEDKVTISFYENIDGKGTATTKLTYVTIFKGDSLGYTPETTATNGNFDNMGWFTVASNEDVDNGEFDKTASVTADTDVFIRWKLYVDVTIDGDVSSVYDGTEKELSYKIVKTETTTEIASGKAADLTDYTFTYKKDNLSADLTDAGKYVIDVNTTDDATEKGIEINDIQPAEYDITKALLTVTGDSATQKQPYGDASEATVTVSGYVDADYADKDTGTLKDGVAAAVKYYSWTDAGEKDGAIQNTEIDSTAVTISNTTPIGYYVIKVEPTSNYKVSTVTGLTTYPTASDGSTNPVYADGKIGENIIFQIAASDPSIEGISIYPVDENASTDKTAQLPLKDSDYTTDAEFDSSEEPTVTDYYIRIDKDNKGVELDFTLTNPDTTTVTYSYGDTTNAEVTPTDDGTYTIKIDELASTGNDENVITITTTSSGGDEITYTFHIQLLVAPKIELSYGNSPYGEIMKASNIAEEDKEAAKAAFNTGNKFTDEYLPTGCSTAVKYTLNAWGGATDSETNMDRNDYAIFIYQKGKFNDPGFKAYDSLGNEVSADKVSRHIDVYQLTGNNLSENLTEANKVGHDITSDALDEITNSVYVRPDVYKLTYSFTDPQTNEEVKQDRYVVILGLLGDTDVNTFVNAGDLVAITNYTKGISIINENIVPTNTRNLYYYRTVDVDMNGFINASDLVGITNYTKGMALTQLYK